MLKISLEYWNELANQLLLISSLLSGFSIVVVANLLIYKSNNRLIVYILKAATITVGCYLATIFSMVKIIMMTTKGYPFEVTESDLSLPRLIGFLTFFFGIISLSAVISLAGWTKSRSTGIFTTIVGFLTFVAIIIMLV